MSDIFFSHVEEDRALVVSVADGLEQAGYTTWYYERDSLPGVPYVRQIPTVIDAAKAIVVVLSRDALASPHVNGEVTEAYRSGKPFVPMLHGLGHFEFRQQRRDWALMLGAAVFVTVPAADISGIVPRILAGLREMNVRPSGSPAAPAPPASSPPSATSRTPSHATPATATARQSQARTTIAQPSQPAGTSTSRRRFVRTFLPVALIGGAGYGYWSFIRDKDGNGNGGPDDIPTVREIASLRHDGPVFALAVHPGEPVIATGGGDGIIRLWNADQPGNDPVMLAENDQARSVAFSPDGETLAAGTIDTASARFWDVATEQPTNDLPHPMQLYSVAYRPDGTFLATACEDTFARLWDLRLPGSSPTSLAHDAPVLSVAFHPTRELLATGCSNGLVRLWDLTRLNAPIDTHAHDPDADVLTVSFSPDGSTLASGSADWTVQLWDLSRDDDNTRSLPHDETVRGIAFHPAKPLLATGSSDGVLRVWNLDNLDEPPERIDAHAARIRVASFRTDGSQLLTAGDDDLVKIWSLE